MLASASAIAAPPLITRLGRLARLHPGDRAALTIAERTARRSPARREIVAERSPVREARAILSGWAFRQRILANGSRQILQFLLPGDLFGLCRHERPLAMSSIAAVTEVITCQLPDAGNDGALERAYSMSAALEEFYLLAQITRLGRLDAVSRLADWLLETHDRLRIAGLCDGDTFAMPLTQEMLADCLGLTSVHMNRTLQAMRRDNLLQGKMGSVTLPDRQRLENLVDYRPAHVAAGDAPIGG